MAIMIFKLCDSKSHNNPSTVMIMKLAVVCQCAFGKFIINAFSKGGWELLSLAPTFVRVM